MARFIWFFLKNRNFNMDKGHGNRLDFAPHPRFSEIWLFLNLNPFDFGEEEK